jgi:hypothetical protein
MNQMQIQDMNQSGSQQIPQYDNSLSQSMEEEVQYEIPPAPRLRGQ